MRCRDCKYFGQYDDRSYVCDCKNMKTISPINIKCENFEEWSSESRNFREALGLFDWLIDGE